MADQNVNLQSKLQCFTHLQRCFTMFKSLKNTFKIISVLSLISLTTLFIKPDVALAGRAAATCSNFHLEVAGDRVILTGRCFKKPESGGGEINSGMAISDYVANSNGRLVWAPLGKFHETCRNARLERVTRNFLDLAATCKQRNGQDRNSVLNLNDRVSNQDGQLAADF